LHLIVGVDPGTTTGLAAIDFKGRVVDLFSSKDLGLDKAVERLVSLGSVSVIATDVAPAPGFVLRLAAKLGAIVYAPPESALVLDKIALTRSHKTGDAHQRDSLAAALIAYGAYRNKFAKIDSLGLDARKADEVKHLFIRGFSIDKARAAVEDRGKKAEAMKEKPADKPIPAAPQPIPESEYSRRMAMVERQNVFLRAKLAEKDSENASLRDRAAKIRRECDLGIRRDSEMLRKDHSIRNLKHGISELRRKASSVDGLRKRWELILDGVIAPVGLFPQHRKGFVLLDRGLRKEEVAGLQGASMVYTDDKSNRLLLEGKDIICADTSLVRKFEGCFYVRLADVEKVREAYKSRVRLEDIVEGYRKERD
jgi:hypothetical protein